jgi:hypothetical protein
MRVLDIDLDAFVHGTAVVGAPANQRLDAEAYAPWPLDEVRSFLEDRCGLDTAAPTPGATFEHHHEAFFYWQRLISAERLSVPFDVVHLDAHSDLSSEGSGAHIYILTELLAYPLPERASRLQTDRVTFANYPAFAVALGWLRSFTWVRPPTGDNGILQYYLGEDALQLKRYPVGTFTSGGFWAWRDVSPLAEDNPVPASVLSTNDYVAEDIFDYVTLCRSPAFTPAASDAVFEFIRRYIAEGDDLR